MILAVPILLKVDGLFIINIINLDLVDRDIGVAGRTAGLQIQINGAAYLSDQFICFLCLRQNRDRQDHGEYQIDNHEC